MRVKRETKRFVRFVRRLDWFEWFFLTIIVFLSTLFWTVLGELQREFTR